MHLAVGQPIVAAAGFQPATLAAKTRARRDWPRRTPLEIHICWHPTAHAGLKHAAFD